MKLLGRTLLALAISLSIALIGYLYFNGASVLDRVVQVLAFLVGIYLWYFYVFGKDETN